jgi:hypothetical protein
MMGNASIADVSEQLDQLIAKSAQLDALITQLDHAAGLAAKVANVLPESRPASTPADDRSD